MSSNKSFEKRFVDGLNEDLDYIYDGGSESDDDKGCPWSVVDETEQDCHLIAVSDLESTSTVGSKNRQI